jgi:hypothetical protein
VTQPSLIFVILKRKIKESQIKHTINVISNVSAVNKENIISGEFNNISYSYLNQKKVRDDNEYSFNIYGIGAEKFIQNIESQSLSLKSFVTNARGVELNKKGEVIICPFCNNLNPPFGKKLTDKSCSSCKKILKKNSVKKDYIISSKLTNDKNTTPIYFGEHIYRYAASDPHYIDISRPGIHYKTLNTYTGPKLLLAKTGQGIAMVVDETNSYTLQVVYIFKIKKDFDIKLIWSLLGILNSSVMHTYNYKKYADPYRTDFPHFTQNQILSLPIKELTTDNEPIFYDIGNKAKKLQKKQSLLLKLLIKFQKIQKNDNKLIQFDLLQTKDIFQGEIQIKNYHKRISLKSTNLSKIKILLVSVNEIQIGIIENKEFIKIIKIMVKGIEYTLLIYLYLFSNYQSNFSFKKRLKINDNSSILIELPSKDKINKWINILLDNSEIRGIIHELLLIENLEKEINNSVLNLYNIGISEIDNH